MRTSTRLVIGLAVLVGAASNSGVLAGQAPNAAHAHIGHIMTKFNDTPNTQGLLPTAAAEAKIAATHAGLAAKSTDKLDAMKLHAGHVINAIDPTIEPKGPGMGYGVKKAAAGALQHVGFASKAEGASKNVQTHAVHVSASLNNVLMWSDNIVSLAQRIRMATSVAEAAPLVAELNTAASQLAAGLDANKDGQIGWQTGEGGLQQAETHMGLMMKGEGLQ
jgi:hypothetical protein